MGNKYRREVPDGTFHARMTRKLSDGTTLGFEWHGGEYIEVCVGAAFAHPSEVINVWDAGADGPRIARTKEALSAKIDDWIAHYGEAEDDSDLVHDVRNNW